jgi:hypothetical protein
MLGKLARFIFRTDASHERCVLEQLSAVGADILALRGHRELILESPAFGDRWLAWRILKC